MSCRFYLPTITSIQRYLKTQSLYGMPVFCHPSLMYRLIRFLHALSARRASSLPDSRAASLVDYPSSCLPAVRTNFIPPVSTSRNVRRAAPATSSPSAPFPLADRACPCISHSVATLPDTAHSASSSGYCGGSIVSSHGSARGGEGEPDMPVRRGSARLLIAFVGYDRCRIVYPFPQVIGAADTRY